MATTEVLTEERFGAIADRWLPLIYKGAIEYSIPGKFDAEDLVQEGLLLLYEEIRKRVVTLQMWEVDSNDFEKYFKSALFHRFVDLKRTQATKKRDYTKEVHATEDYDPLDNLMIAAFDDPENDVIRESTYKRTMERLSETHQRVLECIVRTPEALLSRIREHQCPQCLYLGDSTPDGKCPMCIEAGFDAAAELVPVRSSSRVLQSDIQEFLGMKRMAVSDAIYTIRQTIKSLDTTPDKISLKSFMELFGYGDVVDHDGHQVHVPWPMASSCRYEEGTPVRYHLTYYSLRAILNPDEVLLLDFMVSRSNSCYTTVRFTDMARRLGISVHRVREAVDSIRVKLELVEAGVPLKDVPKVI